MSVNLHQSLYNTADALNVHTRAIEVIGQNIANVNNEAYAARKVRISASPTMAIAHGHKGGTTGILTLNITTERNLILDQNITQNAAKVGLFEQQAIQGELLENLLGESFELNANGSVEIGDDFSTSGILHSLAQFFNACSGLSTNPSSVAEKVNVISQGQSLADQISYLNQRLKDVDEDLVQQMQQEVEEVNTLLEEIALQTKKINDFEKPRDNEKAFEIRESRQANLEKLSTLMNISVSETTSNIFKISCGDIDILEGNRIKSPLRIEGGIFKIGEQQVDITEGRLGGNFITRQEHVSHMRGTLDAWIQTFTTHINEAYDKNNEELKLFEGSAITNFKFVATKEDLTTSFDSSNPNANDRIQAVVKVRNKKIEGEETVEEKYQAFVIDTAQTFKRVKDTLESEKMVQKMLKKQREDTIGVSIDSEMVQLINSQKAFHAASKVITIIDELMETVINMVRH